ncbi:MAG: glutamine--fructose-6-phosphate transaminase (isomerizing) [Woronichinia naegeliana WA131]|jgi:glucosamine--fructose-6-phosphate aminotransferase (isomerizing)|uniref:Glutamine--fructose-6-phosphate aminotransferase [isomerizing] n=1 Tax=Woronichinia naegeliana WA131 TaxID=2824559 RepID=A0A977L133_9CYAN|nr:MAG: glutamine--fructose-6-phosphate transaminase (isomerizing) [Woronichinia naegeliana WA131]
MCGIVGYIGTQTAINVLIDGLERLEYRGYDSAGIATISEGEVDCIRAKGKLVNLKEKLEREVNTARIGIGHTRWATHGKPEERNAHPHRDNSGRMAVVQNGIIENYQDLREELKEKGYTFHSETDTEVIPILLEDIYKNIDKTNADAFLHAIQQTIARLEGAFAIAVLCADYPDELIVARQQAPLILGFGQGEFFCASDVTALVAHTRTVLSLENGEIARLTPLGVEVYDFALNRLRKLPRTLDWSSTTVEKQGFRHFMLKEIYEQPAVVRTCLETYLDAHWQSDQPTSPIQLGLAPELIDNLQHIQVLACGTSWHSALVGKYLLEQVAGIPTTVHYASEFRYSPTPLTPNTLTIGVTQSGETADTLAALEMEKQRRLTLASPYEPRIMGITNRPESTLANMVGQIINTQAGIEIGVAATKTFTAQLMGFYFLALDLAYRHQSLPLDQLAAIINGLRQLPAQIESILEKQEKAIETLAHDFADTQDFIFIGRGINFPIALEGALKLKEISYIHAEGYPAGEMKHGPIALLDSKVPVVAIAMPGLVHDKVLSNAQEAKARDARLIGVTPNDDLEARSIFDDLLLVPPVEELLSPIVAVIPLQLLAYHIAARRGLDVDQPRNLAKSVTVE